MKIRIDEVGYDDYTGTLGMVDFVNGVSVNDISQSEMNRMSVVIRVIDAESEEQVGSLVDMNKDSETEFVIEQPLKTNAEKLLEAGFVDVDGQIPAVILDENGNPVTPVTPVTEVKTAVGYSREQLEALADKEGIAGLREVAETFGVKGTSIVGLIQEVLDAQALKA